MSAFPTIVKPDGTSQGFDKARVYKWLQRRGLSRVDSTSVFVRIKAALRAHGQPTISLRDYQAIMAAAIGEVTGAPPPPPPPVETASNASLTPSTSGAAPGQPGQFFTWAEFERSGTATARGIDNSIPGWAEDDITALCFYCLDPLRRYLGVTLKITSGFRSVALNNATNGAASSQHTKGQAADIKTVSIEAGTHDSGWLCRQVLNAGILFDQCIWYSIDRGGHVHISYNVDAGVAGQRQRVLYAPAHRTDYIDKLPS